MPVEDLSDSQLYALVMKPPPDEMMSRQVVAEFKKRNFTQEQLDQLSLEFEKHSPTNNRDLSTTEKIAITLFPVFIPIQAVLATLFLWKGNQKAWKQYWKYLTFGLLLWTIIAFILIHFFFNNSPSP